MHAPAESSQPSRGLALKILERMGESGIPPERGIGWVNVGNGELLGVLDREYLDLQLGEAGGSTFKLVQATYGAGKTHFLYCLRDRAWQRGYLAALVNLSPNECPFHEPLRVYAKVAEELAIHPTGELDDAVRGIPEVLRAFVDGQLEAWGDEGLRDWLTQTLPRMPVDRVSLRKVAQRFMLAHLDGNQDECDLLEAWLLAHEGIKAPDVKHLGIFEVPSRDSAMPLLRSLVQLVRHLDYKGTVLLFDEAEKTLSISGSTRVRDATLNNLRELIDLCGKSQLPGTMMVYAVTPEFTNRVMMDYPALKQRIGHPLQAMSVRSPKAPLIDLETLEIDVCDMLEQIGLRLADVFAVAYQRPVTATQRDNAQTLAQATADTALEFAHRRLFVKTWIRWLDEQRLAGTDAKLTAATARRRLQTEFEQLETGEEDEDFSDV